ncbi:MAG TPA: hypothetical protein VEA99_05240 [Gemmatimonadaceae bacterium]|nr:hypothetical protein [Gemmatimonadaceae bacterium]
MTTAIPEQVGPLRRLLLVLVLLTIGGLLTELLLHEHWEDPWQFTPLVLLGVAAIPTLVLLARPSRGAVQAFRVVMGLCVVAGALGVLLHYKGNAEFELEGEPTLRGLALFWTAVRGATPALAPGAMAQLGLLGLAITWRHPALATRTDTHPSGGHTT